MAMQSGRLPGANLMRAPLIRRTVGFAAGSSSSRSGSRLRGGNCGSAHRVAFLLPRHRDLRANVLFLLRIRDQLAGNIDRHLIDPPVNSNGGP